MRAAAAKSGRRQADGSSCGALSGSALLRRPAFDAVAVDVMRHSSFRPIMIFVNMNKISALILQFVCRHGRMAIYDSAIFAFRIFGGDAAWRLFQPSACHQRHASR